MVGRTHAWTNQLKNQHISVDHIWRYFPVLPWLTTPVFEKIRILIENLGMVKKLGPGELLFPIDRPISSLVIVKDGLVSRSINAPSGEAINVAPPNHVACGNLNFFTHRPCFGKYTSVTETELIFCPRDILLKVISSDPKLLLIFAEQFELISLSDRLAFICLSVLGAEERLKAFTCAWGISYGMPAKEQERKGWIKMPFPLTRQLRALLINASDKWVDVKLREWRELGLWERTGNHVFFLPQLFEPTYAWLRQREEARYNSVFPQNLVELFRLKAELKALER